MKTAGSRAVAAVESMIMEGVGKRVRDTVMPCFIRTAYDQAQRLDT